jgi:hypothetical protein
MPSTSSFHGNVYQTSNIYQTGAVYQTGTVYAPSMTSSQTPVVSSKVVRAVNENNMNNFSH